MGYCPFSFCVGSRYNKLYRDTAGLSAQHGGQDTNSSVSRYDHDTARRPCDTASLRARRAATRERMAWPLGVSRDTNFVSWLGVTFCVAIRRSKAARQCSSALRYDAGALRHARQRARHGVQRAA